MRTEIGTTIYRQDYQQYPFELLSVELQFDLAAETTTVHSELLFKSKNPDQQNELILNGQDLSLLELSINDKILNPEDYRLDDNSLRFYPPDTTNAFKVNIVNICQPEKNTSLMGLYKSEDKLFTQCEAEGFRRITWFPDRPDVMAPYKVTLRARPADYPTLLSNGNLIAQTDLADGRIQAVWQDPFAKPCYLFALVAGDFDCLERTVTTRSGKEVLLQVYSDRGCKNQTQWAMDCLARALHWDEQRFNLELDLNRFMVVAARDFNMGAMENKGLNIFNAAYVLADPKSTTDSSYRGVESVIGHEYFHNWTGNRVTCRDWFQLSLKEGLTVFRDQEFSADMLACGIAPAQAQSARAVKRIQDVTVLRQMQFPEDASPMAHPIRPDSYQEISNFYTATIYEKGAEVIRMLHTILGEAGFQAGMQEYFKRHDGQAVTCDDFIAAMESVYMQRHPGQNLNIFKRWYSQSGTPTISLDSKYDAASNSLHVTLRQSQHDSKQPLHIPVAIGLLSQTGQPVTIKYQNQDYETMVLELTEPQQEWLLTGIPDKPIVSILRGFSAPVILAEQRPVSELITLAAKDTDPFARWDASQTIAHQYLQERIANPNAASYAISAQNILTVWRNALSDSLAHDYKTYLLQLPSLREVIQNSKPINPHLAQQQWDDLQQLLANNLYDDFLNLYQQLKPHAEPYNPGPSASGQRSLRNLCLNYLFAAQPATALSLAKEQYRNADNMTASLGALTAAVHFTPDQAADMLADFEQRWQHNALVLDRWFAVQASAPGYSVEQIDRLMQHADFSLRNPNRARSLIFRFCMDNPRQLHTPAGYLFWAEQVLALDAINPEIAARLARAFDLWDKHEPKAKNGMHAALLKVQKAPQLSPNVREIISKALGRSS